MGVAFWIPAGGAVLTRELPHFEQKAALASIGAPHFEQYMTLPVRLPLAGSIVTVRLKFNNRRSVSRTTWCYSV
jgi:hypothetical protein